MNLRITLRLLPRLPLLPLRLNKPHLFSKLLLTTPVSVAPLLLRLPLRLLRRTRSSTTLPNR